MFLPQRSDHSPITPTEGTQTPFITPEGGNIPLNRGAAAHESDNMIMDSMAFNSIRVHGGKEADGSAAHMAAEEEEDEEEEVDHNSMDTD